MKRRDAPRIELACGDFGLRPWGICFPQSNGHHDGRATASIFPPMAWIFPRALPSSCSQRRRRTTRGTTQTSQFRPFPSPLRSNSRHPRGCGDDTPTGSGPRSPGVAETPYPQGAQPPERAASPMATVLKRPPRSRAAGRISSRSHGPTSSPYFPTARRSPSSSSAQAAARPTSPPPARQSSSADVRRLHPNPDHPRLRDGAVNWL